MSAVEELYEAIEKAGLPRLLRRRAGNPFARGTSAAAADLRARQGGKHTRIGLGLAGAAGSAALGNYWAAAMLAADALASAKQGARLGRAIGYLEARSKRRRGVYKARGLRTPVKRFFRVDENADYTTARKPKIKTVKLKGLIATQSTIHRDFRSQKNPTPGPISVYRSPKGQGYIIEGHHRAARAADRGAKRIKAFVYREPRIKKALIRPGKPALGKRIGFLLSTGRSERNYKIGRYLEGRKRGLAIPGTKKPRRGAYAGVYATGVNKSEHPMDDATDKLYVAIEKARGRGIVLGRDRRQLMSFARTGNPGKGVKPGIRTRRR